MAVLTRITQIGSWNYARQQVCILSKTDYSMHIYIYLKSKNVLYFFINVHTLHTCSMSFPPTEQSWIKFVGNVPGHDNDQVSPSIVLENYLSFTIWLTNVCFNLSTKIIHTFLAYTKMSVVIGQNRKSHVHVLLFIYFKRHPGLYAIT